MFRNTREIKGLEGALSAINSLFKGSDFKGSEEELDQPIDSKEDYSSVFIIIHKSHIVKDDILESVSALLKKIVANEFGTEAKIYIFDNLPTHFEYADLCVSLNAKMRELTLEEQLADKPRIIHRCVIRMAEALRKIIPETISFEVCC